MMIHSWLHRFPRHARFCAGTAAAMLIACAPPRVANQPAGRTVGTGSDRPLDVAGRARQILNRFTFGATPAGLEQVKRMGVDAWFDRQLHPERISDPVADSVLDRLDITHKSAFELSADHPSLNEFGTNIVQLVNRQQNDTARKMAAGDSAKPMAELAAMRADMARDNQLLQNGTRLAQMRNAAVRELSPSILLRATLSERQVLEVMTAFWENHFSVSADKMPNPFTLVDYDRTIREHALGKFRNLLDAVAKSPAMLYYLDNYQSVVDSLHPTMIEWRAEQRRRAHPPLSDTSFVRAVSRRRTGINENYARELMELHTLGVDGGYSQHDIQEVARCLTGWGIDDFQYGGTFAFHAAQHDAGEKVVLGTRIQGGRGIEDGEQVLNILARHPSTARFIARKLIIHFVSDAPPPALVERVAQTYMRTDGDIREVLRAIVSSKEFNDHAAYRSKVKTPFELTASILRVMNATPDTTQQTANIPARLGQRIFGRLTPEGWPDQSDAWMNSGALINRMNLGAQTAAGQIPTVKLANWKPGQALLNQTRDQQVSGIVDALLAGDASAETRQALLGVDTPPQTQKHIGDLVSIAIASPDFQRR